MTQSFQLAVSNGRLVHQLQIANRQSLIAIGRKEIA